MQDTAWVNIFLNTVGLWIYRIMANVSFHFSTHEEFMVKEWELAWCFLILVTGASGNLLVCLVICKSSSAFRSTPFNMILCSLAVTDMLLALVVLPNYVLSTSIFNHPDGLWGDVMCKTITGDFLTFYFSNVSGYTLVLITLERLRAVQKSSETISNSTSKGCRWRAWLSVVSAWLIPLAVDGPGAFYILNYKREKTPVVGDHCIYIWEGEPTLNARIYGAAILIFEGLIPLIIFVFSFYHIRKFLVEEEKRMSKITGNAFNEGYRYYISLQMFKRRQKTVKVLMITSAVYVVCWIPNKIMFFMVNYVGQGERYSKFTLNSDVYQIGILLGFQGWISDMGIDGPTFVPKSGYCSLKLQLHDAIYQLRFYSNSLIHILLLSNSHNNVASIQKNRDNKLHCVIVA